MEEARRDHQEFCYDECKQIAAEMARQYAPRCFNCGQADPLGDEIPEVQRYAYKPGDRIILRYQGGVSWQQAREITEHFRRAMRLPDEVPVVVLDESLEMEIVEPET